MEKEKGKMMKETMVKKGKKGVIIATVLILMFGGFTVFNYIRFKTQKKEEIKKEEKIPVEVTETKFMSLEWVLEQTGEIRPLVEVDVYPKIPGKIIERIMVERGDYVKKGKIVATLEDNIIQAQLAEAKAALESAKARLRQIEANLEAIEKDYHRLESLYKEKAIAKQKLDHIEAEYQATIEGKRLAEAQIKQAKAVVKRLEILHKDHKIFAPVNGYVSARYVDPGAMSDTKMPVIRISHEEELKIVTSVTEKDFPHIEKGMKVEIKVDAYPEKVFTGTVSIINPTIDPRTRTGEIEIHIPNKDLTLSSGMFAHIRLYLGERRGLVVPRDGLNRLPGTGSYYVYVVENGRAVLKNIKTGIAQENYIEVIEGLKRGEKVVVRGQNRLKDGTLVFIVKREGAGAKGERE
jgi:HlyD family secretion protein